MEMQVNNKGIVASMVHCLLPPSEPIHFLHLKVQYCCSKRSKAKCYYFLTERTTTLKSRKMVIWQL